LSTDVSSRIAARHIPFTAADSFSDANCSSSSPLLISVTASSMTVVSRESV
jgi:hypothetical protein